MTTAKILGVRLFEAVKRENEAMTVPTQAQREAAARAMFELEYKLMGSDWVIPKWDESHRSYWVPLASAALTAAAEVGQREMYERELELTPGLRSTAEVGESIEGGGSMTEKESTQLADNSLKEIERLWVGINQAMTLLARDDLLATPGYRRLQALLKNDYTGGKDDDTTFHWLGAEPGSGPC